MKFIQKRAAFTLIELLTVVAILLILVAMLMPALERARYQAACTACAGEMKEWGPALTTYAGDHNRKFPARHLNRTVGRNPWNMTNQDMVDLEKYGLVNELLSCPVNPSPDAFNNRYVSSIGMKMFGYTYWVPRTDNGGPMVHPSATSPSSLNGTGGNPDNPMLSDTIGLKGGVSWTTAENYTMSAHCYDKWIVDNTNNLYYDGSLRRKNATEILLQQTYHFEVYN